MAHEFQLGTVTSGKILQACQVACRNQDTVPATHFDASTLPADLLGIPKISLVEQNLGIEKK